MYRKLQVSGLSEIVSFTCISATWDQHPASWFLTSPCPQFLSAHWGGARGISQLLHRRHCSPFSGGGGGGRRKESSGSLPPGSYGTTGRTLCRNGPQPFRPQGSVLWKTVFPGTKSGDGFRTIQVRYVYCVLCLYYYISSTSDHQAFGPGGWGPLLCRIPLLCQVFIHLLKPHRHIWDMRKSYFISLT